jgi:hypothetical protein
MGMIFVGRRLAPDQSAGLQTGSLLHGEDEQGSGLDLDKAWHGIHFLLNGSAWETAAGAGEAVLGGDADDFDAYLLPSLTSLREFYVAAAQQEQAVLLAIT